MLHFLRLSKHNFTSWDLLYYFLIELIFLGILIVLGMAFLQAWWSFDWSLWACIFGMSTWFGSPPACWENHEPMVGGRRYDFPQSYHWCNDWCQFVNLPKVSPESHKPEGAAWDNHRCHIWRWPWWWHARSMRTQTCRGGHLIPTSGRISPMPSIFWWWHARPLRTHKLITYSHIFNNSLFIFWVYNQESIHHNSFSLLTCYVQT